MADSGIRFLVLDTWSQRSNGIGGLDASEVVTTLSIKSFENVDAAITRLSKVARIGICGKTDILVARSTAENQRNA